MSEFIVSARKYRPATFDTVVGQMSITTTLKNSIKNSHLGQAYLFCGPRGVGKTTCARIYAKTLNCLNLTKDIEACNECESCRGFNESASYNIHELDAASNNSVEDIRSLIDQVRIPPQLGKYSIYIIDEVHMLSTAAFNAFLKTLEEPPKHAIFILATTEKHKILPTILSRCQIFDFNRIKVEDAANHLAYVAKKEGIDAEPEALNVIAMKADGAMRDALSIFDQVVSFCGKTISYKSVIENLNVLDYDYYFGLVDQFLDCKYAESLLVLDEILDKGFDGHNFINGLCSHFRDLLVCKDEVTVKLLEVGAAIKDKYVQQARRCPAEFLFKALDIGSKFDINYKSSKNKRLHIELAMLQFCNIQKKKSESLSDDEDDYLSAGASSKSAAAAERSTTTTTAAPAAAARSMTSVSMKDMASTVASGAPLPIMAKPTSEPAYNNTTTAQPAVSETIAPVVSSGVTPNNVLTQELILSAWNSFGNSPDLSARIASFISNYQPELSRTGVSITLPSESIESFFVSDIRPQLLPYLRNMLQNNSIDIKTTIAKNEQTSTKPYSTNDKFEHLRSKNPLIDRLRDSFGLEIQ